MKLAVRNPDLCVVEPGENKSYEPLAISTAVVAQQANRMRFAQDHPLRAVGSIMNAGSVAAKRAVARELFYFVAKVQRSSRPCVQRRAVNQPPSRPAHFGRRVT